MKKIISFLLVAVMLLPGVTVTAANKNLEEQNLNVQVAGDKTYTASDLYYEILDENGSVRERGQLDQKVTSSGALIIDHDVTGTGISLPSQWTFVFYPKNLDGFYWGPQTVTYLLATLNGQDSIGLVQYQFTDRGTTSSDGGAFFGTYSSFYTTMYNWIVPYKVSVKNLNADRRMLTQLSLSEFAVR